LENNFLETIVKTDEKVLIFLNNLGGESWDAFWLFITKQLHWTPFFILILILIYLKFGLKKTVFTLLFLIVLIALSDQITNLIKILVGRKRPCNTEHMQEFLRQFKYKPGGKSFWSGHAFVSTTFTVFTILLLRPYYKFVFFLLIFPMLFGYSRIYLGVHYPVDVSTGYLMGVLFGFLFYKVYQILFDRVFNKEK